MREVNWRFLQIMILLILEKTNLFFGGAAESLGMMLFGVVLIAFAIGLRWVLVRAEQGLFPDKESARNFMDDSRIRQSSLARILHEGRGISGKYSKESWTKS